MRDRLLYGWTFQRGFYLVVGSIICVISIINQEWIGIAVGTYFASMGLFAFGCAGGHCYRKEYPGQAESDPKSFNS